LVSIAHNLKKIWIARGKLTHNNKILFFELIINSDYLNCDSACLVCGVHRVFLMINKKYKQYQLYLLFGIYNQLKEYLIHDH